MSVEKITKAVNRCTCDLPDCIGRDPQTGQPRPWDSETEAIPKRCSWCKRRNWNGRKKKQKVLFGEDVVALAIARGATSMTVTNTDASGNAVGTPLTIPLPAKKVQPSKRAKIALPKPKKVRSIE